MKEVPLTHGYTALVDDEDFARVLHFKWHPKIIRENGTVKRVYATRNVRNEDGTWSSQAMHTFILGMTKQGKELGIDHRDHNGLNNQRCNLRVATKTQNMRNIVKVTPNTSGFKGVEFTKRKGGLERPWRSRITVDLKKLQLGYFADPLSAAVAYDMAAVKNFGEFAYCNFARSD
jgi:hypothetical protein